MSRQAFIFVGTTVQDAGLTRLVEQALNAHLHYEEGTDPYLRVGPVAVYLGRHEFDDDDITWPEGSEIPLHGRFPVMIETRDTSGDLRSQQQVATKIFDGLRAEGRWPVVYIDDMQKVLDRLEPPDRENNDRR
jgi:hypothetical protein